MRVIIRFGSRLSRFVSGSAAAHALALAVVLVVPFTRARQAPIENATVVALAGPIGGSPPASAPPAPPAAKPEPPAPAPPPKEAHTVKEIPAAPKVKVKPEPAVKKKEAPKEQPEPVKPAAPATEKPAVPGAGTGAGAGAKPGPGAATGITASVGNGDASLNWYGAAVKAALEAAWQKPYLDDQTQTYSVVVAFEIAKDGTTRDVHVVEPSGVPSLDRSAVRAVMEASPLPAVPPTFAGDVVPVTMRFNLNPEGR
ncbi:MAG TPA: TonB family protein [Candidatus Polarisedimenticolaceae bacterium]|nr:TonB family protein [Candidatus Polarisedimenticolaceae bacterium]